MQIQILDSRGKFLTHFGSFLPKNGYGIYSLGLAGMAAFPFCQCYYQPQADIAHLSSPTPDYFFRPPLSVAASTAGVLSSPRIPITGPLQPYTYRTWGIYRSRGLHNAPFKLVYIMSFQHYQLHSKLSIELPGSAPPSALRPPRTPLRCTAPVTPPAKSAQGKEGE